MSTDTGGKKSWAEHLGSSLSPGLEQNILEVVLDKEKRGPFAVSEEECVRMMTKLGIDVRPGGQVEGVQICPSGRGIIFITMCKEVDLSQFCRYEALEVTSSGIWSSRVKPAGKREVVVTLRGVHPNTRDTVVISYLSRFGRMVTTKVVHEVYGAGPLKGLKNGNRSYKMEIKPGNNIGSFHIIEGQKVSVRYSGQLQTCGRCHNVPSQCMGNGFAKDCEAKGGIRVEFTDYIKDLWKRIGYSPKNDELDNHLIENAEEAIKVGEAFTPVKFPAKSGEKYGGVVITQFPKGMDNGKILEFLCRCSLPENKKDDVKVKDNGKVIIKNLSSKESSLLIEAIHGQTHFDRRMFCNGLIPLTPEKPEENSTRVGQSGIPSGELVSQVVGLEHAEADRVERQEVQGAVVGQLNTDEAVNDQLADQGVVAGGVGGQGEPGDTAGSHAGQAVPVVNGSQGRTSDWSTEFPDNMFFRSSDDVVRRHSISLTNRTPPRTSIAADILGSSKPFQRTKLAVEELKDLAEKLSDFNSCISDSGDSTSSKAEQTDDEKPTPWKTMNEKKRYKKNKRKHSTTPNKDQFLKKSVLESCPL